MIPTIARVWYEQDARWTPASVPVTPHSTCRDLLDCVREPGDEPCALLAAHPTHGVHILRDADRPLAVLAALGTDTEFLLKYLPDSNNEAGSAEKSNGMKEPASAEELLEGGVQLTLEELRAMALRQQQQIDTQHRLLCAKVQRLRYLKQQEARQHQVALESERLRRLRERVEAQEVKLRKLRALRGQVDRNKQANAALTSDLESIRALFNEKEKELSVAVAKVEELTRQLEELRRGRPQPLLPPAAHELDKLRRELMYRNKLNEQQNGRLSAQRSALGARQEEMRSIDRRVSELQARLLRKRALNRQLRTGQRLPNAPAVQLSNYPTNGTGAAVNGHLKSQRGNIAAVEPYNHVPHAPSLNHHSNLQVLKNANQSSAPAKAHDNMMAHLMQQDAYLQQQKDAYMQQKDAYLQQKSASPYLHEYTNTLSQYPGHVPQGIHHDHKALHDLVTQHSPGPHNEHEFPPEFAASKSDPKYQTLPYNTKFQAPPNASTAKKPDKPSEDLLRLAQNPNPTVPNINHMTVHSTPLSVVNKSLATPLAEGVYHMEQQYQIQKSDSSSRCNQEGKENGFQHRLTENSKPRESTKTVNISMSSASSPNNSSFGKPISSVAPTSVHKPSPIYQTSSTKIQPVQPQTVGSTGLPTGLPTGPPTGVPMAVPNPSSAQIKSNASTNGSIALSPPQNASTPLSTPDVSTDKPVPKPALPPKPAIKTPPRQTEAAAAEAVTSDASDDHSLKEANPTGDMIIKARPLTIRKQPLCEQPRLKSITAGKNGVSVSLNRRIEMPPAFLFPEMDRLAENALQKETKVNGKGSKDELDKMSSEEDVISDIADQMGSVELNPSEETRRSRKGNLKQGDKAPLARRVSFDPLALLLDASLEGELELVKKTATQVQNASAANDEGITALHNAICAGHFEIVKFLVGLGCDVNAQDSDGWTPLHCAASCNNLPLVRFLVDNGACIFATTLSDHETAAEKCEEDEEGFDGCSEYLYSVQEKLGIMNGGAVFAVFAYSAQRPDELSFDCGDRLQVLRKGDDREREWWWGVDSQGREGYVPRNLLGLYPRVAQQKQD